jgi:hypothetical protein
MFRFIDFWRHSVRQDLTCFGERAIQMPFIRGPNDIIRFAEQGAALFGLWTPFRNEIYGLEWLVASPTRTVNSFSHSAFFLP